MSGRRRQVNPAIRQKLIGFALVLAICTSFFPLPIGRGAPSVKDASQPFPCQNRPCGCANAEQCWTSCCCFTDEQKLAWAENTGVTPPDFVVKNAEAEASAKAANSQNRGKKTLPHCIPESELPISDRCCAPRRPTCCSKNEPGESSSDAREHSPAVVESEEDQKTSPIIGIEMLKCRGQGLFWNALPWAVIPTLYGLEWNPLIASTPSRSRTWISLERDPPEPPPRLA